MSRKKTLRSLLSGAAVGGMLAPLPASATDGVIEINQPEALAGGINGSLVDDPPGFPVAITQSGSYRLTSNLVVTGSEDAISISDTAPYTTLDLNGFAVLGNVQAPPGVGIAADTASHVTVKNGAVVNFDSGLDMGPEARIDGLVVDQCLGDGLIMKARVAW